MNQSDFGKLLRDKRKEHHKTQEEVANSINKNKMLISGMETGKNNPPIGDDLKNIMECLGLNEEEEKAETGERKQEAGSYGLRLLL